MSEKKYSALRLIAGIYTVFGWIAIGVGLLIFALALALLGLLVFQANGTIAGILSVASLPILLIGLAVSSLSGLGFIGFAELLRLMMSIEENTHDLSALSTSLHAVVESVEKLSKRNDGLVDSLAEIQFSASRIATATEQLASTIRK